MENKIRQVDAADHQSHEDLSADRGADSGLRAFLEGSMKKPVLAENERQALHELKECLQPLFGRRLKALLLYGSKARGFSDSESDIDVLAVIENLSDPRAARNQILHETTAIDLNHNVFLSVFTVDADYFRLADRIPFFANVKADGVLL